RGRGRRSISEINMVPFIDVMLVLLIIFMVSAPLITTGVVDLPSMGRAKQRPPSVIEVIVGTDEQIRIRVDKTDPQPTTLKALAARVGELQNGRADVPVIIAGDKAVRYESIVKVMDTLQKAGVQRVGLAVKQLG
ncbi:MAG TPA: ExbD/TolR family protein, partial [Burkholderiaceae bacterium]